MLASQLVQAPHACCHTSTFAQMPILLLPDGSSVPESEVIAQYLLDKAGGGMQAPTPELRAVAALATRIHDQYITPIQVRCVSGWLL